MKDAVSGQPEVAGLRPEPSQAGAIDDTAADSVLKGRMVSVPSWRGAAGMPRVQCSPIASLHTSGQLAMANAG